MKIQGKHATWMYFAFTWCCSTQRVELVLFYLIQYVYKLDLNQIGRFNEALYWTWQYWNSQGPCGSLNTAGDLFHIGVSYISVKGTREKERYARKKNLIGKNWSVTGPWNVDVYFLKCSKTQIKTQSGLNKVVFILNWYHVE